MVPRVRISSGEIPLRSFGPMEGLSRDDVGVRVVLDDEDDDEPDERLRDLRNDRPFDFGRWAAGIECALGKSGGREIGLADGEPGLEFPYSLGVDAGVVVPGVVEGSVSLLRLEDPKLLRLELSRTTESSAAIAGDMEIWVASSPLGMGTSSPFSVTSTARRGSGRGAKRIFLADEGQAPWYEGDGALERCAGGAKDNGLGDVEEDELVVYNDDEGELKGSSRMPCFACVRVTDMLW